MLPYSLQSLPGYASPPSSVSDLSHVVAGGRGRIPATRGRLPGHVSGTRLFQRPALSLLAPMVPTAKGTEIALAGPAARFIGDRVVEVALPQAADSRELHSGPFGRWSDGVVAGSAGNPGPHCGDHMCRQPAESAVCPGAPGRLQLTRSRRDPLVRSQNLRRRQVAATKRGGARLLPPSHDAGVALRFFPAPACGVRIDHQDRSRQRRPEPGHWTAARRRALISRPKVDTSAGRRRASSAMAASSLAVAHEVSRRQARMTPVSSSSSTRCSPLP
jgi:hypothetical protein